MTKLQLGIMPLALSLHPILTTVTAAAARLLGVTTESRAVAAYLK